MYYSIFVKSFIVCNELHNNLKLVTQALDIFTQKLHNFKCARPHFKMCEILVF